MIDSITTPSGNVQKWLINDPKSFNGIGPGFLQNCMKLFKSLPQDSLHCLWVDSEPHLTRKKRPIAYSGGNLKELSILSDQPTECLKFFTNVRNLTHALARLSFPTIASAHGQIIGGGWEFFLSFNFRFVTKESSMVFKQLDIGLPTGFGGAKPLVDLLGSHKARELIYERATLGAEELLELGLVNKVFATREQMLQYIFGLSMEFGKIERNALTAQANILASLDLPPEDLAKMFMEAWGNPTHLEVLQQYRKT